MQHARTICWSHVLESCRVLQKVVGVLCGMRCLRDVVGRRETRRSLVPGQHQSILQAGLEEYVVV